MLDRLKRNIRDEKPDVSPRTRAILSNERWYRDGSPRWLVGKAQNPAETADKAHDERLKLANRLLRYSPETHAVAHRLDTCAPRNRCMSAACPECTRAYSRWFVSSAETCLNDLGTSISILSLVHADLAIPVGQLTPEHIHATKKTITRALTKAGITTFLGGTDISANEHHPSLNNTDSAAEHSHGAEHNHDEHGGDAHHHWQMQ